MKPILEVQNIAKKFRIQHLAGGYLSLRERITKGLRFGNTTVEEFWALKDVSFDVQLGESIGIIGRNGAGKSTLLKILSKITPPSSGKIISRGRVASLLEVGTGFHPELTGRENIFFNGSLLGMKRREIESKFDEIVDFSGTEKFLDTPLKHYSSGMQLRLAFSVAAFLEPEILIIDEVLAVGDAEFQKKCLGKMKDVSKRGRTILFVSHNLPMIKKICTKGVLLDGGQVVAQGDVSEVVDVYLNKPMTGVDQQGDYVFSAVARVGKQDVFFEKFTVITDTTFTGGEVEFEMLVNSQITEKLFYIAITIFDENQTKVMTLDNLYSNQPSSLSIGRKKIRCRVENFFLLPGKYSLSLWCANSFHTFDQIDAAGSLFVEPSDFFGSGKLHNKAMHGIMVCKSIWKSND